MSNQLKVIDNQQDEMIALLESWANINSGSENLEGLREMRFALKEAFAPLGGECTEIEVAPTLGQVLVIRKHPEAPFKILLGGHMDIALTPELDFEGCRREIEETLLGRGVADMKGGLVIMLKALEYLEQSPHAGKIGWTVLINADEELGSPGSRGLIANEAKDHHIGLVFEPSFPDGQFVSERKGSANFTLTATGISAHAGRDFFSGKNALTRLARAAIELEALTDKDREITVNIGKIEGGGPVNIVPDQAICRFNVRVKKLADMGLIKANILKIIEKMDGVELIQDTERPPKPFDAKTRKLFEAFQACGKELGMELEWRPSGGVCDGNTLASEGLPTIDTLGVVGGNLHRADEYAELKSLTERTKLVGLFLERSVP